MRDMGLQGVVRGRKIITTNPDAARPCPQDKVSRVFRADRPNRLWGEPLSAIGQRTMASDFTYVPTWSGTVYVAFVIDVFARRIVGWRVSGSMTAEFVLDALEQAIRQRNPHGNKDLVHHSDRGSQGGFNRSSQQPADGGCDGETTTTIRSIGARADHFTRATERCAARGSAAVLGTDRSGSIQ